MKSAGLLLLLVLFSTLSFAGNGPSVFKGRITDAESREPIPGAAIVNQADGKMYYTDLDGYFEITLNPEQQTQLQFQALSYESRTLQLSAIPSQEIKVEMQSR